MKRRRGNLRTDIEDSCEAPFGYQNEHTGREVSDLTSKPSVPEHIKKTICTNNDNQMGGSQLVRA